MPAKTWPALFVNVKPGVYLAGDAFGGASVNGALRSSAELFDFLKQSTLGSIDLTIESGRRSQ